VVTYYKKCFICAKKVKTWNLNILTINVPLFKKLRDTIFFVGQ